MFGSKSGSRLKVLAKQPFSVPWTIPPGISAMKSSWTGSESFWVVNVVVVLPVPDRPMIRKTFSSLPTGTALQPACMASPPRSWTMRFHIRRPPFFDSPK